MNTTNAHSSETMLRGTIIGDRFVIQRLLGSGGMGDVYLAENRLLPDKKYAIKVLKREFSDDPRFSKMLLDEALKQSRLNHENVVQTQDFLQWDGRACLIQGFVEGQTLADLIARQPQGLPVATALPLMVQILKGLDAAHEKRVLHCDVKPANVIVDGDGHARVTDFGIARDIGPIARDSGLVGAGTPDYMSPEQIVSPLAVDHRTDVFSAGIVFFEMMCGQRPFVSDEAAGDAGLRQVYEDAPDIRKFNPAIAEPLARIVATALQRDADRRFQGCGEFVSAILEHQRRERWRRTWLPALSVAAVVAIVAAVGLYQWRESMRRGELAAAEQVRVAQLEIKKRAAAAADDGIRSAATSLNLMCREWIDRQVKGGAMPTVLATENEQLITNFKAKLADIDRNIASNAARYNASLAALVQLDRETVSLALQRHTPADTLVPNTTEMVRADTDALRTGNAPRPANELLPRCPPPRPVQTG